MWNKNDTMDIIIIPIFLVFSIIVAFIFGFHVGIADRNKQPKVDLPEEYKEITQTDILRGHFKNDTLYLRFDNTHRTGYELHVQNDTLRVTDPNNGNVIYKEKMNWNAPTLLQECIIKDNF